MPTRRRFLLTAAASMPAMFAPAQGEPAAAQGKPTPSSSSARPAGDRGSSSDPSALSNSGEAQSATATLPAPLLALKDRSHDAKAITVDERNSRLDRARELMKDNGLNAILLTTGASMLYFTGAHWGQSERLFAYVLPQSAAPFVICPYLERDRLNEAFATFPERDSTLTFLWQEHENPYTLLGRALADAGVATGALGLEEHVQFAFANSIAAACPALKVALATPVTAGCRSLKSPAEISLLRLANDITWNVYRAVFQSCGPGDTNRRFSDLVNTAYTRCGVRGEVSCNVGPNSAVPHGSARPQTISEHDVVLIDDGCTVDGYTSDISRSFVYGTPTDEQRKVFDIVHQAQAAALATARPGVEMQAVDAAARKVIVDAGYGPGYDFFNHRVGHGIGLDMHEWPYLVGGNTGMLTPGMVFSDEPGIYIRGKFGIRLEDDMFLTAEGAQLFTPQSPSLGDPFGSAPKAT